jgi:ribosomal protein L31
MDKLLNDHNEDCPITIINPDGTIVEHANPSLINETQSPFHIDINSKPHKFITDRTAMMDETIKRIQKLVNLAPKSKTKETKKKKKQGKIEPKPVTVVKHVYDYLKLTAKSEEELQLVKKLQDRPLKKFEDVEKQDDDLRLQKNVENAKREAKLHHKDIILNASNMVALVNLYDKHPFYFITPGEARMAIDYIKDMREDNIKSFEYCKTQDDLVRACIQTVAHKKKFKAWEKNDRLIRSLLGKDESPIINIPFSVKKSKSREEYQDKIVKEAQNIMSKTPTITVKKLELPNINVFNLTDNKFLNITSTDRAFKSIDKLFTAFESYEAIIDSIIVNPNSY